MPRSGPFSQTLVSRSRSRTLPVGWLNVAMAAIIILPAYLGGCGAATTSVATSLLEPEGVVLGLGSEGGEKPSLIRRSRGGYVLAYAGARSAERHIYVRRSEDGIGWSAPEVVARGGFAAQAPALAEDAAGRVHLFFVSNRSGETQAAYQAAEQATGWTDATAIAGFDGAQDLAVTRVGRAFLLVAEVMGAGVLAAERPDGASWTSPAVLAPAGAEPAAAALPDGRSLVTYQLEGKVLARVGGPGTWSEPIEAATGASRLRDPAVAWAGPHGLLVFSERIDGAFRLRARRFDEALRFEETEAPPTGSGDARGAAIAPAPDGALAFAWGIKTPNGQQGVMVSIR